MRLLNGLVKKGLPFVFALSFVLVPCGARAEVVDRIVAVINESIITLSELNAATAMAIEKLGLEDRNDARRVIEVKGRILDSLIEQKLIKQASDKAGIDISEREIDNAVEDVKKQNDLTQDQLLLALAQNGLTFKEYREQLKEQIRQVKFINKEFRSKINILEEDLRDYYTRNQGEFYGPASYRMNMIFLPSANKAQQQDKLKAVKDGIARGADFRQLASHYSEGPEASLGGDLGYLKSDEMSRLFSDAASKLKPGEVSPPISAPEGVYFLQMVDVKHSAPRSFDDVRWQIHDKLFKQVMDERFNFWLSQVKKFAHIEIRL